MELWGVRMMLRPGGVGAAAATTVPRRHASQLSYEAFTDEFMAANMPVIIEARLLDSRHACAPFQKRWALYMQVHGCVVEVVCAGRA